MLFLCGAARALERAEAALGMSDAVLQGRLERVGASCGHASRGVAPLCKEGFGMLVLRAAGPYHMQERR